MVVNAPSQTPVPWMPDDWLTRRLSLPCHRVGRRVSMGDIAVARPESPGFYSIKIPTGNHALEGDLYAKGFRLFDMHVSLNLHRVPPTVPAAAGTTLALATRADIPAMQAIAVACFGNSRFHRDARLPREGGDAVWRQWVNDAVEETGRVVIAAQQAGSACGFISLRPQASGSTIIDLMAVARPQQRSRVGEALLGATASFVPGQVAVECETEAWNTAAINFYCRLGFVTGPMLSILHRHEALP